MSFVLPPANQNKRRINLVAPATSILTAAVWRLADNAVKWWLSGNKVKLDGRGLVSRNICCAYACTARRRKTGCEAQHFLPRTLATDLTLFWRGKNNI